MDGQLGLDNDPARAIRKKNFLNALHGAIDTEHINLNPILSEISKLKGMDMFNPSKRQPFGPATKTFRLDRIFDVTRSGNRNSNVNVDRAKKLLMPTEIQEGSPGSFFRPKSSRDKSAKLRTFKSPVYLKDGSRLSGVADNPEQNPFYGYDKNGQEFSQGREYINPQDITKSRDSDRTANQIRNELESGQKLFMPASEAGAGKGKIPKSGDMLTLDDKSLKLFLPSPNNPNASLSDFKGKNVQVLTSDLSVVGNKKADGAMISFTGGPGYLSVNDAWGFTNEAGAKAFKTRWERDGKPLIGITSMKQENHRASTLTREYYVRKFMEAINGGKISENTVNRHIKTALKRAIDGKNGLTNKQKEALKTVKTIEDFLKVFPDKELIPWKATPMIYGKLDAKTLPIKQDRLKKLGLDTDTILRETRQPEYNDIKKGSLLAIAEYDLSLIHI